MLKATAQTKRIGHMPELIELLLARPINSSLEDLWFAERFSLFLDEILDIGLTAQERVFCFWYISISFF